MTTNKQRREAERRRLQQQLEQRRQREASRKTFTLITSVVATLVVIAAVIVVIVIANSGNGNKTVASQPGTTAVSSPAASAPTTSSAPVAAPVACTKPAAGTTVTFDGVTVQNPTNLTKDPKARSSSTTTPNALACADTVVGTGKAAAPGASVTVQYAGLLYKSGTAFDSSWSSGQSATFALKSGPGGVIDGFNQGIGGIGKVAPMREGGRRIIIMPASLGYGVAGSPPTIPANAPLVFVVDLVKVNS